MYIIKEINDQKLWDDFFNQAGSPSFLQSWEWGEFEKKQGYKIERVGIYDIDQLVGITLVIIIKSKRGNFLFIPHGPIFMEHITCNIKQKKSLITQLLNYLITLAKKGGCSFIRIAPTLDNTPENQQLFKTLDFKTAPIYMHSETMWILPLNKTEDELLAQMRKTTRYLIKKAVKEEITIEKRTDSQAVDDFYKLFKETVRREKFTPFSKKFIKDEFETFHKTGNAMFLLGKIKKDSNYLASALIIFTKSTAFYHQGASIHSKYPVPYLLQWEAIKEAKRRGCSFYNFWGILKKNRTPKNWAGLTLFKQGFGGEEKNYLPTQDLIISPKYYFTFLYEKFLNWKRGV